MNKQTKTEDNISITDFHTTADDDIDVMVQKVPATQVSVDESSFTVISGDIAQTAFESIDTEIANISSLASQQQSLSSIENDVTYLGGLSGNWQSTYTTVCASSSDWVDHFDSSLIADASGNWNSTYTTVCANSANWESVDLGEIPSLSGNWQSTYTTVCASSADWNDTSLWEGSGVDTQLKTAGRINLQDSNISDVGTCGVTFVSGQRISIPTIVNPTITNLVSGEVYNNPGNIDIGQVFTSTSTTISSIYLLAYIDTISAGDGYRLLLYEGSGYGGTIIASREYGQWFWSEGTIPGDVWGPVKDSIWPPLSATGLTPCNTYTVRLTSDRPGSFGIRYSDANPYQDGYTIFNEVDQPNSDLVFEINQVVINQAGSHIGSIQLSPRMSTNSISPTSINDNLIINGNMSVLGYNISADELIGNTAITLNSDRRTAWPTGFDATDVIATSGNWNSTYTTVCANSANWESPSLGEIPSLSGNWQSTYTTVCASSANWDTAYSTVSSGAYQTADRIDVTYEPVLSGYTATTNDISGHFDGIDTKFNQMQISANQIVITTDITDLSATPEVFTQTDYFIPITVAGSGFYIPMYTKT